MMTNKKNEKSIRELAHVLVSAQYHSTSFSSKMERVYRGDSASFPCVMIEPLLSIGHTANVIARKESRDISRLIKAAKLPTLNPYAVMRKHIELMSTTDASVNELIGQIKAEIMAIDERKAGEQ